jgi:hypothetical protein
MKKIFSLIIAISFVSILNSASNAQLNVQAVVSSDYSFYDQWYRTVSESVPLINKSETVYHDQPLFVYVFFSGYGVDSLDMADVNYNLRIFKPDSSLLEEHLKVLGYKGKIVNPNNLILSIANLRFNFEMTEPIGNYRVEAELVDNVLNDKVTVSTIVTLSELSLDSSINNDSLLGKWLETYYQTPIPELAVDAFIYFTKSGLREIAEEPVFAFFRVLFGHNLYLVPHLISKYDFQDETTQNDILMLLAFLDVDVSEFINQLPQNKLYAYQQLKENSNLFDYSELEHPTQLDMIWSEFFASGRYGAIRRLVDALSLSQYKGAIDLYNNSGKAESLEKNALLEASYKSVVWSLGANAKTHKLIKDYLTYILKNEPLDDNVRNELENIIIN